MDMQFAGTSRNRIQAQRPALSLRKGAIRGVWLALPLGLLVVLGACTTTKRAAQLVVDHHVGMARGAMDIMSGEAEAREQRVAKLRSELEANQAALAAEHDPGGLVELLKQHVALQDALIAELLQGHGHHSGHQHAAAEGGKGPESEEY